MKKPFFLQGLLCAAPAQASRRMWATVPRWEVGGGRFLVGLSELLVGMICLSICLAADDMSDRLDRRARDASVVGGGFGSSQKSTCK